MKEHIQDATSYQHPNNVGMDVGWRNLGVMKKLFEKIRKGKMESCIELLIGKINGMVFDILCGHGISFH